MKALLRRPRDGVFFVVAMVLMPMVDPERGGRWSPFSFAAPSGAPRVGRMRDALMRLLEPPVEALGYELVDIEFAREGRGGILRIFIDRRAIGEQGHVAHKDSGGH